MFAYPSPIQDLVVLLSFFVSIYLCLTYEAQQEGYMPLVVPTTPAANLGRVWRIPTRVRMLKGDTHDATPQPPAKDEEILFRYTEYAITAPLLFLSIVGLLLPGAPVWLVCSGYFFLVACNLFGVQLHLAYWDLRCSTAPTQPSKLDWLHNLNVLLFAGQWDRPSINRYSLMWGAWVCLITPVVGLFYLAPGLWTSSSMPWEALAMIWMLIFSYLLFGIIPSILYASGTYQQDLPWLLDLLNLLSKFPIPVLVGIAFVQRPGGFASCAA
jgi:hypothetical protein